MSVIVITTPFYKALMLQGEIWCWSLLGRKGLTWPILMLLVFPEEAITYTYLQIIYLIFLLCSELEIIGFLHEAKQWTSI